MVFNKHESLVFCLLKKEDDIMYGWLVGWVGHSLLLTTITTIPGLVIRCEYLGIESF